MAKIIPVTQREQQIIRQHGADGWYVLAQFDTVLCLNGGPGVLVQKEGHTRWVKAAQVVLNDNDRHRK